MRSVWDWYKRCPDGTLAAPYVTPCSLVPHLTACRLCSTGQWAQSVEDHSLLDYRVDADGERVDKGCNPDRWRRGRKATSATGECTTKINDKWHFPGIPQD